MVANVSKKNKRGNQDENPVNVIRVDTISPLAAARAIQAAQQAAEPAAAAPPVAQPRRILAAARSASAPTRDVNCADSISAVLTYWGPDKVLRFLVAVHALIETPRPLPPTPLTPTECADPYTRSLWMSAMNQWLLEQNTRSEEAEYACTMRVPVDPDRDGRPLTVSLAHFVGMLCERLALALRPGLFDDLDEMSESQDAAKKATLDALTSAARGVAVLLLAHDFRVRRLLCVDCKRYFADEVPPDTGRLLAFLSACQQLAQGFQQGHHTFADLEAEARECWMFM